MNWKKQLAAGRGHAVTLKESDGISYRNEKMLLSSVKGLSEAKPSCPSQYFAFKQLLIPLDIPRFWNGTAWPLPDRLLLFKTASASRRYYKAQMPPNQMADLLPRDLFQ